MELEAFPWQRVRQPAALESFMTVIFTRVAQGYKKEARPDQETEPISVRESYLVSRKSQLISHSQWKGRRS
jgi:hypothetical protein